VALPRYGSCFRSWEHSSVSISFKCSTRLSQA
jgi:hypothetical protein